MTLAEKRIRAALASGIRRAATTARGVVEAIEAAVRPDAPFVAPAAEPDRSLSEALAARLGRTERREAAERAERERQDALLANLERVFAQNAAESEALRARENEDQRPPAVIAAWLEVAS